MSLLCPCCGRVKVQGLRKSDEQAVIRLDGARDGLTLAELFKGRGLAPSSHNQVMVRLRQRLAPLGYTIVNANGPGGAGRLARYRLEKVGG